MAYLVTIELPSLKRLWGKDKRNSLLKPFLIRTFTNTASKIFLRELAYTDTRTYDAKQSGFNYLRAASQVIFNIISYDMIERRDFRLRIHVAHG
jgi:hypothetical protein